MFRTTREVAVRLLRHGPSKVSDGGRVWICSKCGESLIPFLC